mgnify:CR=1 FL=1
MTDRGLENQAYRASRLTLVTAAIVHWNTLYMGRAVEHLRASGGPAPDAMLAHVSPLGWRHVSLTGGYLWQLVGNSGDGYRELNLPRSGNGQRVRSMFPVCFVDRCPCDKL